MLSLSPGFLRQDVLNLHHLIRKHALKLLGLHVELTHHLLLQRLHLGCALHVVISHGGFQGVLTMSQLVQLHLQLFETTNQILN